MLGMIIGVAAVITMVALGNGAQQSVEQEVRSAGTNIIQVNAGNYTRGGERIEDRQRPRLGDDADAARTRRRSAGRRRHQGHGAGRPAARVDGVAARRRFYGQVLGTDVAVRADVTAGASSRASSSPRPTSRRGAGGGARPHRARPDVRRRRRRRSGRRSRSTGTSFTVAGVTAPPTPIRSRWCSCRSRRCRTRSASRTCTRSRSWRSRRARRAHRGRRHAAAAVAARRSTSTRRCRSCVRAASAGNQMPAERPRRHARRLHGQDAGRSEALTKGLYTSVAAFVLANMPKVDEVNLAGDVAHAAARGHAR